MQLLLYDRKLLAISGEKLYEITAAGLCADNVSKTEFSAWYFSLHSLHKESIIFRKSAAFRVDIYQ